MLVAEVEILEISENAAAMISAREHLTVGVDISGVTTAIASTTDTTALIVSVSAIAITFVSILDKKASIDVAD